ncbi:MULTISPECIES: LysR family transcriptional regulator [unclassified Novosphingobium]|uniref:LysR family transcriptional regulator n=1 Tax=unclassified Novosphingobium TaxID=2644732 RepID=UPI001357BD08|nr:MULTISPECIES: LysR family transcriptional regulator [unclassified Novosphingobium]
MDKIGSLTVFVAVAEAGSFASAGRHLGVSASAIGKSIARLEERVAVRLFHRSTRSIALTSEGSRFLERARRILAEIEAAEQELGEAAARPGGRLRISLPMLGEPFSTTFAAFAKAYPEILLDAVFTDRMVDVVEEGFDAVLRTGEIADSGLTARRLGSFRMMLVASPAYLADVPAPRHTTDLAAQRCIVFRFSETGRFQPWLLAADEGLVAIEPKPAILCSSLEGRLGLARAGAGIAYLPDFTVRDDLAAGTLVPVLDTHTTYSNSVRLLWAAGRHMPPKLRAFVDFLTAHLPLNP